MYKGNGWKGWSGVPDSARQLARRPTTRQPDQRPDISPDRERLSQAATNIGNGSSPSNISTKVKLMPAEDEWVQAFQDWFFGKMHPRTFLIIWSPVTYKEVGLLCGVNETTVARWVGNQSAKFHYDPPAKCQRLLAFIHCWLIIFDMTPAQLIAQFEQELRQ